MTMDRPFAISSQYDYGQTICYKFTIWRYTTM